MRYAIGYMLHMKEKSLAQNAAFMTIASTLQKIVSFVYFTIIARDIGAESTGKYFFALSFTTVFVVFVDLGFTNVLVREGARAKDKLQVYLGTLLPTKIILGVLSYLGMYVAIRALGYPLETRQLVYLSGVTMLFDSLHLTLYGVLRVLGELRYEAISIVVSQCLSLILGTIFLTLHFPLIFLMVAFVIPSVLNVGFAAGVLMKRYQLSLRPDWDGETFRHLRKIAIPFAIAAVLARVYSYTDSIILSKLAGDVAVGWYSIPYKITFAFQFIPLALVAAVYPRFSAFFVSDKERLRATFTSTIRYLSILIFPIVIGIMTLSRDIVLSVYSAEFLPSIEPLRILLVGLVFSFMSFPVGAFLNACDRQRQQTTIVAAVLMINILLNVYLIPRMGVSGAAIAATIGNALLAISGFLVVRRVVHIWDRQLITDILLYLLSALVMGGAVWYVNTFIHFTMAILIGMVIYPSALFATKRLTMVQLKEMYGLIRGARSVSSGA